MKNVTALYFSPTNGTLSAVKKLLTKFTWVERKNLVDNTLPKQREKIYDFTEDELVLIANPVYAGQIPQVNGLWKNLRGHDTPCIIMACYGNRHYDDTLAQMQYLLEVRGFRVVGAIAAVIPHVFAPKLGYGRPDVQDEEVFEEFSQKLKIKLAEKNIKPLYLPGEKQPALKNIISVPKDYLQDECKMCGNCANFCPVGAINSVNMEIDTKLCISCMRCVKICYAKARNYDAVQIRAWLENNFSEPKKVKIFI